MSGDVFCDYLDVTCDPETSFSDALTAFMSARYPVKHSDQESTLFQVGVGTLKLERRRRFHRASASGACLDAMRSDSVFTDYLSVLSGPPHAVTRLDAALDVSVDAPVILRDLERRYPRRVAFTRKSLAAKRFYSVRDDGQLSGTWYVGHRSKAAITARVYDKQLEQFEKYELIIPPLCRYELTFRRSVGCTLRDAYMPESLFYEYASVLLERPKDVPAWIPNAVQWSASPIPEPTFEQVLRRVDDSPELSVLIALCGPYGEQGEEMLISALRRRFSALRDSEADV